MKNLNVAINMSGCQLANHIREIGLDNIKMMTNNDELLGHYTDDELIDEIVNNNDRDIREIITELFESCIVPNNDKYGQLMSKLDNVLSEVM